MSSPRGLARGMVLLVLAMSMLFATSCSRQPDPNTAVVIIESSPTNLDPRIGTDAQSERIDELLFDALLRRDNHFNLKPWLATSWEIPNSTTYIFHLRHDVHFADGRLLTSADVKWTFDSIMSGKLRSPKASTYEPVDHIDAPDPYTVIFHLKRPWASLLWNLSDGAIGIVPYGALDGFGAHPIGTGPFKFVSAAQDRDVIIERNNHYWGPEPKIPRVRFIVVPDTTTRALELRKGSADVEVNALTPDTVLTLKRDTNLVVQQSPGTIYAYLALNLRDPILKHDRVRRAIAHAIDLQPIIHYLWRDMARPANSVLPPQQWAYDPNARTYAYDPARAKQLLDEAGYPAGPDGIRFQLVMKTSTEETTRLLAVVLQQQLRAVGIVLNIQSYEFATFYSDVTKGAFQLYSLRWIGGNEDPDIFEYIFDSHSFPPRRANRSFYANPRVDQLIADGLATTDQQQRKADYWKLQEIVNEDLPYINLWYLDNVVVHTRRITNIHVSPSGNYDFLTTAELVH